MERCADVAVIGGGILGLAHAFASARRGLRVVLFERSPRATGASIRNFGMIWPIGQPAGEMYALAMQSRAIWLEILKEMALPHSPAGSFHVVYQHDEAAVVREFTEIAPGLGYQCAWLDAADILERSSAVRPDGLLGGLWSETEITVDPRLILSSLPEYLNRKYGVQLRYGTAVTSIELPRIKAGAEEWRTDYAIVCGGDDFETLFPADFATSGVTRVKLQMLRTPPQPKGWLLGPALAAGLTLRFYPAFNICTTLP